MVGLSCVKDRYIIYIIIILDIIIRFDKTGFSSGFNFHFILKMLYIIKFQRTNADVGGLLVGGIFSILQRCDACIVVRFKNEITGIFVFGKIGISGKFTAEGIQF